MGILKRLYSFMSKKEQIDISPMQELFSKYGPCRARMYKYKGVEYLLFMSKDFNTEQIGLGYIYRDTHAKHQMSGIECNCNNQIDLALKLILEVQGFAIYATDDYLAIEECLRKIGAKRRVSKQSSQNIEHEIFAHELGSGEYALFIHIMQELGVQRVRLISSDPGIALSMQRFGIELVEWSSVIGFEYGDSAL